jgi:hypothetical protein
MGSIHYENQEPRRKMLDQLLLERVEEALCCLESLSVNFFVLFSLPQIYPISPSK